MERVGLKFEFLPSEEEVFDALVPLYIRGIIYSCMVEAYVSEQSARMAAMDEASKSAEDMLGALQISYNRVRQAGITQEMSEIVGGSAALGDR
jgi:F-type H+-transporting ATPase subunit gamma